NDRNRQRIGKTGDQIHLAPVLYGVEQFIGNLLNTWAQLLDHAWGERFRDQAAQACVVRWICHKHIARYGEKQALLWRMLSILLGQDFPYIFGETRIFKQSKRSEERRVGKEG